MTCRILIVQHGEKERLPGDPGLTEKGRVQAELTAQWLGSVCAPAHVVSSPLRRAVETAAFIASVSGAELSVDPRLRERMNWDGEEQQGFSEFLAEWQQASLDRSFVPRSGDSSQEAGGRFIAALAEHAKAAADNADIVVVAHGGVTVDALRSLVGDERLRTEQPGLIEEGVSSCAVTELRWKDRDWQVRLPSAAHLHEYTRHRPA